MPFWLPTYYLSVSISALFYVGLALSWNIVGGIGGELSLGHSLFIACGAVLSSALTIHYGWNPWLTILLGVVVAAVLGAFIAWVSFRFRLPHLSFALVTLAFGEIALYIVLGTDFLGGASGLFLENGAVGLANIQFSSSRSYFWLLLVVALIPFLATVWVLSSRLGFQLQAVRDNEQAAAAIGIDILKTKIMAMVLSSSLSTIVAGTFAHYVRYIDPYFLAGPLIIIEIVLFVVIGGLGTLWGPVIGAGLLFPLGEILRGKFGGVLPGLHYVIYGALIITVILFMPEGVVGGLITLRERVFRRRLVRAVPPASEIPFWARKEN